MLSAIKDLGVSIIRKKRKGALDIFVENPNATGNYTGVITIDLEQTNGLTRYKGVGLEDYNERKMMKYLYRRGSATGSDFSPTAKISGKPAGTVERKILGWFKVLDNIETIINDKDKAFLHGLRDVLIENEEDIKEKVVNYRKTIPNKEGLLLTLKINLGGKGKYVGDFKPIVDVFLELIEEKDKRLSKKQQVCSLCGTVKDTVLGNIDTYAFYTTDKPGYIIGGFNKKRSWRNFPVCSDCKLGLEEGKTYLEQNLTFRFCGIRYNLIPKFIMGNKEVAEEVTDVFTDSSKLVSLKQSRVDSITGDEEEILAGLQDIQDVLTLNFLFIQKAKSAERIRLVIEDVFPSRLKRIFSAKHYTDEIYGANFTFATLRGFLSKSDREKRNTDLDKYFLDTVDRVFSGNPVSYHFMIRFIMLKVRAELVNDGYFNFAVRDGLMVVTFLRELGLFEMGVEKMEDRVFSEMFSRYDTNFETPLKRGLFLLGSLTEMLLRKQYVEREARPFLKNLKNLRLNERDFKGLLPKVQNKLEEYDSFDKGKKLIAGEAANYLLISGDKWTIPVDEMNFYFAAGMNLVEEVGNIVYPAKQAKEKTI